LMRRAAKRLGFSSYLNPVITSAGVKWRKPNPHIFHLIMEEWGLGPDEIIMVGDSLAEDIAGAHCTGMRAILLEHNHGGTHRKMLMDMVSYPIIKPDATICCLAEVPAAITCLQNSALDCK
jgi:FMN phosphatase YigB (HAD superfamily)